MYKSKLVAPGNHLGVLGGPHAGWSKSNAATHVVGPRVYFTHSAQAVKSMYLDMKADLKLEMPCTPDSELLEDSFASRMQCVECHCWEDVFEERLDCGENPKVYACFKSISSEYKRFQEAENIGGSIEYRCTVCRNCHACKNSDQIEAMSLQEEKEQAQIEGCVRLDSPRKTLFSKINQAQNRIQ